MILLAKKKPSTCEGGHVAWKGRQVSQNLHIENVFRGITLEYSQSLLLFRWEEILSEFVHTSQVTTSWTSVPTRWTDGWVEATKKSTELSSGR